jgi:hypothetical protein
VKVLFAYFAVFACEKPALDWSAAATFHSVARHIQPVQEPERFINIRARSVSIKHFGADFSLRQAVWSVPQSNQDLVCIPVPGARTEYPPDRFLAVAPQCHCGVVMLGANKA